MNKILIVDDNYELRKLLRLTLGKQYELTEASSVYIAEAMLELQPLDAVILDIMIPGYKDGFQLCEFIKMHERFRDIHVVLLTAKGQELDKKRGYEVGANAYFIKPFSPTALLKHLDSVLGA